MRIISALSLFGASAAATAIALFAVSAESAYLRLHSAGCNINDGLYYVLTPSQYFMYDEVLCPLPSSDRLPHEQISTVHVYGNRGPVAAWTRICSVNPWTYEGDCGDDTIWGYNNFAAVQDMSLLRNPHQYSFPYLQTRFRVGGRSTPTPGKACSWCYQTGIYVAN